MILALAAEKGGVGKTTLSLNLAAWRAAQGRRVLLVDADRAQASASAWIELRMQHEGVAPIQCAMLEGNLVAAQVRAMAQDYDDIVIDCRGAADRGLSAALSVAHRCVTPVRPGQFDLLSLANMAALVDTARGFNPELDAVAVVNQAPTTDGGADAAAAREAMADVPGYRLAATTVHLLKPFARCASTGLAVTELEAPTARAARELGELAAEVWA